MKDCNTMGATKRYLEQLEAEKHAKQEALLDLPNDLSEMNSLVETLQSQIKTLHAKIECRLPISYNVNSRIIS